MSTKYKGTEKQKIALNTYIKLIRASETITSKIKLQLSKENLSFSQFEILDALYHYNSLNQKSLGEKLMKSGGNITHVIDNLVKMNLVSRNFKEGDRRQYLISLTKEGKETIEKILPKIVDLITEEISVLEASEQKQFQLLCKKIGLKKER